MRRAVMSILMMVFAMTACNDDVIYVDGGDGGGGFAAAPRALAASYYAGSVTVTWELAPSWDGESFRVYSRRTTDRDWFWIAEVTSCVQEFCSYEDLNVSPDHSYEYLVAAVDGSGGETDSEYTVEVYVPSPVPPPVPDASRVIALDNANYLTWGAASTTASDFSFYRVYLDDGTDAFLLGETDSEGFLDLLAQNGGTYAYFVTAVDVDGHESAGGAIAEGTPRPDFTGEWVYDAADVPASSGFRFVETEELLPIVDANDPSRHFRLESDLDGWWLVPGPGTAIYPLGFETTALKCGPAADATCSDVSIAPLTGYVTTDVSVAAQESYVLRVIGDDGEMHYGVIRVQLLGFDGDDSGIMIFDWAYQLQAGNPALAPGIGG